MSKMGQFFLSQQEDGKIPTEPEDYYEFYNRKRCSISTAFKGEMERASLGGNGSRGQHTCPDRRQEGIFESGGLCVEIQQKTQPEAVQDEVNSNGRRSKSFQTGRRSDGKRPAL